MNRFFESLINLLFPPKCPFCGKVLDAVGICSKCEKDLPWLPEEQVVMTDKDLTCAAPLWYEGAVPGRPCCASNSGVVPRWRSPWARCWPGARRSSFPGNSTR